MPIESCGYTQVTGNGHCGCLMHDLGTINLVNSGITIVKLVSRTTGLCIFLAEYCLISAKILLNPKSQKAQVNVLAYSVSSTHMYREIEKRLWFASSERLKKSFSSVRQTHTGGRTQAVTALNWGGRFCCGKNAAWVKRTFSLLESL